MTTETTTHSDARFYQFTLENQVLDHVKTALRKTLASDEDRMGLERKVSMVKFVTESLVRHLIRLLDLEDETEAADPIEESKPHLSEKTAALQFEHSQFRAILREMSDQVSGISADNEPHFDAFCRDVLAFLDRLDQHEARELAILQELHNAEEGGEG
jgi:hypothetical protein